MGKLRLITRETPEDVNPELLALAEKMLQGVRDGWITKIIAHATYRDETTSIIAHSDPNKYEVAGKLQEMAIMRLGNTSSWADYLVKEETL